MWHDAPMGWERLLTSLVSDLAWPLLVGVALVMFRVQIKKAISRLTDRVAGAVDRMKDIAASGYGLEVKATLEATAGDLVRSNVDTGVVLEPLEGLSERVTDAGSSSPTIGAEVAERLRRAINEDERRRRAEVEDVIKSAVMWGFALARDADFASSRPDLVIEWGPDGVPRINGAWAVTPDHD
jgi:hypothetical protein